MFHAFPSPIPLCRLLPSSSIYSKWGRRGLGWSWQAERQKQLLLHSLKGPRSGASTKKGGSLAIHPLPPPNCRGGEWLSAEFGRKVTNRLRGWARRRRRSGRYHRRTRKSEKGFLERKGMRCNDLKVSTVYNATLLT